MEILKKLSMSVVRCSILVGEVKTWRKKRRKAEKKTRKTRTGTKKNGNPAVDASFLFLFV
jgi:hypothetical protein